MQARARPMRSQNTESDIVFHRMRPMIEAVLHQLPVLRILMVERLSIDLARTAVVGVVGRLESRAREELLLILAHRDGGRLKLKRNGAEAHLCKSSSN